jgi:hypothetical protein
LRHRAGRHGDAAQRLHRIAARWPGRSEGRRVAAHSISSARRPMHRVEGLNTKGQAQRLKEEGRADVLCLCKASNTWRASTRPSSRRSRSPSLGSRSKCSAQSPATTCREKQRAARFGAALEGATAIARGTARHDGRRARRRGALPHNTGNSREKGRNQTDRVLTARRR